MSGKLLFILGILFVNYLLSFLAGVCLNSAAAFTTAVGSMTFFVGFYAVGVLDYKIGGAQLTLEKRVDTLEQRNKELQTIVTALLKALYVVFDGANRWGGPGEEHKQLTDEYLEPIRHLIAPGVLEQVNADIASRMPNLMPNFDK